MTHKTGRITRYILYLLLAVFLLPAAPARASSSRGRIDGGVQKVFTAGSGLLSTAATAIAQTSDGFIWIGGYGGLVRYDGRSFEPCLEGELAGVQALLGDDRGGLFIATNDLGLIYCRDGVYTRLYELEGNPLYAVSSLAEGADGRVYFGTESGIGFVGEDLREAMLDIPEISGEFIIRLLPLRDDELLAVTRGGELCHVAGGHAERIALGEDSRNVRCVAHDADGQRFFVGTQDERFLILDADFALLQIVETPGLECINDIRPDKDGTVWFCSDSGVGSFSDGEVQTQSLDLNNSIDHMLIDEEGSFWFISSRQGVLEVSPCRFGNISRSAGLGSLVVNAVVSADGRLYIGHDDGLVILSEENYTVIEDPNFDALRGVRIRSILEDGDGGLWFFTKGLGALHFDRKHAMTAYSSDAWPVILSDVFRCGYLSGGTVLAGSDIGAYLIDRDGVRPAVDPSEHFGQRVLSIAGSPEHFLLGTDGYGLYEVEDGKITRHIAAEDGLGSNVVMKIRPARTTEGCWLVLGNGLAHLGEDGTIRRISSVPSRNVLDFIVLDSGEVWIPAGTGIFRADEKQLYADAAADVTAYHESDGLPYEITANANPYIGDDLLYLCGTGGIMSLSLSDESEGSGAYPLVLDRIYEDREEVQITGDPLLHIPADTHRIDVSAHVLTYRTDNPYIYYYLEGFDSGRTVEQLSQFGGITYTNLDAGNYCLHFGLTDRSGEKTYRELSLNLLKMPRWYELTGVKAAFVICLLALLAGSMFLYFRSRMRREKRKLRLEYEQKEKERLHEIAYRDYLTGLYNRNYLNEWEDRVLPGVSWPVSFLAIDLNDLKIANDTYGHKIGDQLLTSLSTLLREEFPDEMSVTVFRTGGDEFLVLLTGLTEEEVQKHIDRLRERASHVQVEDISLSFCAGICEMNRESFDLEKGIRLSDLELLREKNIFHNRTRRTP